MSFSMITPAQLDISTTLCGSQLGKAELEIVATNIIIISRNSSNRWIAFSWEEYQQLCSHPVKNLELQVLNELKERGYLTLNDGKFSVTPLFFKVVNQFLDTPEYRAKKEAAKKASSLKIIQCDNNLRSLQQKLKAHEGQITFDVLKAYASQCNYSVNFIVRSPLRTDLYIDAPDSMQRLASEHNLQAAVEKALEVIVHKQYGW